MDLEKQNVLLREHPLLFRDGMVFECGDGWFDLIRDLSVGLEAICNRQVVDTPETLMVAEHVKEKFGGLRFYVNFDSTGANTLITKAEHRSTSTCELCGRFGRLKNEGGWMRTRCETHSDEPAHGGWS